jgi:phosphopantothenoylcysteine decarboxylase / phosphopantothenate---cysteine ligase
LIVAANLRIVLGISGGIAAYKTPALIRLLQKSGAEVKAVCTPAARTFVTDLTLSTITGHTVYMDDPSRDSDMEHIALAKWADYCLVCPATANTIAKITHGIADNLLTSLALSFEKRLVIAPAMNTAMWQNSTTRENIASLVRRGTYVLPVGDGDLACGDEGPGRLIELETIVDYVSSLNSPKLFAHKKVLISSGPTWEPIDPVRDITNRSSGKMGAALARAAWLSGAQVTVVSGPAPATLPPAVRVIRVTTALEMLQTMEREFANADVCIMAAAVADFRPREYLSEKKHRDQIAQWNIELVSNPDIAEHLGKNKNGRFLVGFSLETDDGDVRPLEKMKKKNCDMMVVNRAETALEGDSSIARILYPDKTGDPCGFKSKREIARFILERVATRMGLSHG